MPDRDLIELVRRLAGPLLDEQPWLGWLLVALCRQRARQTWLLHVHNQHLRDVEDWRGDVPGLAGWSFDYHGSGLCLIGPDGEALDVDFDDGVNATIDPYFFAGRVHSLRAPELPEARIQRFLPSSRLVVLALEELRRAGAIHHPRSEHVFLLCDPLEARHGDFAAIDFDSFEVGSHWAERLGDPNDEATLRRLRRWLVDRIEQYRSDASLLRDCRGLLEPEQIQPLALGLLAGPVDSPAGSVLDALRGLGLPPAQLVVAFLDRLDPAQHHPYPAHALTAYLLEHNIERARCLATIEAFAAVDVVPGYRGNPYLDHLALLMFQYAPDRAWPLFRRAVHASTPAVYHASGAVLALLDDARASQFLLEGALAGDATRKRFLLACLSSRRDEASRALAAAHMPPPPAPSTSAGYTFEEVQYNNLPSEVEQHLARAKERLQALGL